jgi:DNA-binding NtrC family response regulator
MADERIRSLLLLNAEADECRLISAIAARAGWSVAAAPDEKAAASLLKGPHGRDIHAARLASWNDESGPGQIAALRGRRDKLPVIVLSQGDTVSVAVEAMRAGATDFLVRPVAAERLLEALATSADRRKGAGAVS